MVVGRLPINKEPFLRGMLNGVGVADGLCARLLQDVGDLELHSGIRAGAFLDADADVLSDRHCY